MKRLKPVEDISTDDLLKLLGVMFTLAFSVGLLGGMFFAFISVGRGISKGNEGVIAAFAAILLLLFVLFADRHIRKNVIPEIKRRCQRNYE
jgi:hypothetical protein